MTDNVPNPLNPEQSLKRPLNGEQKEEAHPPQPIFPEDSAVTKAEKIERNGLSSDTPEASERPPKRVKVDEEGTEAPKDSRDKVKGIALVKSE